MLVLAVFSVDFGEFEQIDLLVTLVYSAVALELTLYFDLDLLLSRDLMMTLRDLDLIVNVDDLTFVDFDPTLTSDLEVTLEVYDHSCDLCGESRPCQVQLV